MARHRPGVWTFPLLAALLAPVSAPADDPPCARPVLGVAWWARPSDTGRYVGYSVGGSRVFRGDEPGPDEGTWGWDYGGLLVHPHIHLLWGHGGWRRDVPAYRTVGTNAKGHSPSSP